jgi:cardiolipin synthase A/B
MGLDLNELDDSTVADVVRYFNYVAGSYVYQDLNLTDSSGERFDYTIGNALRHRIRHLVHTNSFIWDAQQLETVHGFDQDKLRDFADTVRNHVNRPLLRQLAPVVSHGNQSDAFVNGPDCLRVMLQEFAAAHHYIHLQVMLFFSDQVGWQVANVLAERARAGVKVRVMADTETTKSGYYGSVAVDASGEADFNAIAKFLRDAGAQVIDSDQESYPEWEWDDKREQFAAAGVPEVFLRMQDLVQDDVQANWNVVDHRKFAVIDGVTSLIGSLNIGSHYLYSDSLDENGLPSGVQQWHDGLLRIRGPFADGLNRLFASTWMVRGGDVFDITEDHRSSESAGHDDCALLASFPGNPINLIREYYLALPAVAKGKVFIQNPYISDERFFHRLGTLSKERAADITLINPYSTSASDYPFQTSAVRCNMRDPFERGVRFFDFSGGHRMSHWKTALDDSANVVCHGSYNINYRSALHDFESVAIVRSERLADQVRAMMDKDVAVSEQITDIDEFFEYPGLHLSCQVLWAADWYS